MSSATARAGGIRPWLWVGLVLLVAGGGAAVPWQLLVRRGSSGPDMVAVLQANNRGVGHLEQYRGGIAQAVKDFEEVARLAPDWTPGQINLGIALMNYARGPQLSAEEKEATNK